MHLKRVKKALVYAVPISLSISATGSVVLGADIENSETYAEAYAETYAETYAEETYVEETYAPDDTYAEETYPEETYAPETYVPETYAPETYLPETDPPETYVPETYETETYPPETNSEHSTEQTTDTNNNTTESGTESESETHTETETGSETESETTTQSESETHSETSTETDSTPDTNPGTETETNRPPVESETETEIEEITEQPSTGNIVEPVPGETNPNGSGYGSSSGSGSSSGTSYTTNSTLVAAQNITYPSSVVDSFRFSTIAKKYAASRVNNLVIYEETNVKSRAVGLLTKGGLCYIIEENADSNKVTTTNVSNTAVSTDINGVTTIGTAAATSTSAINTSAGATIATLAGGVSTTGSGRYETSTQLAVSESQAAQLIASGTISPNAIALNGATGLTAGSTTTTAPVVTPTVGNWTYIESGKVRGFVKTESLVSGAALDAQVKLVGEDKIAKAVALVQPLKNEALSYTKTTVYNTVADKVYALASKQMNIVDEKSTKGTVIGTLAAGSLCYILADADKEWTFVESGDVRGFVKRKDIYTNDILVNDVTEKNEASYSKAVEVVKPEKNKACYYTFTSISQTVGSSDLRQQIVDFAFQFLGNPYVWGGESLTEGADCSGYVQAIYAHFGYSIPRVAEDQAQYGTKIALSAAQPGDLIFYSRDGYIYHVVMYIGNGMDIEAANSSIGIVSRAVNTDVAVWATRIIEEDASTVVSVGSNTANTVNNTTTVVSQVAPTTTNLNTVASAGQYGTYLGNFMLTAYCNCSICCGQWADGLTASGTVPTQGRTVAMGGVPFGTKLVIGGVVYTVEDRGTPYGHVDIYFNNHATASSFGVQYAQVYLLQ